MTIVAIQEVRRIAITATLRNTDVEKCNPYPDGTGAHRLFVEFFTKEREEMIQLAAAADLCLHMDSVQPVRVAA